MKKQILFCLLIGTLLSTDAWADVFNVAGGDILYENGQPFNEYLIYTPDKKCALHYLSPTAPADNWHIQITKQSDIPDVKCLEKGFASVNILDDKKNVLQTLNGYFLDGFFVGVTPLNSHVIKRSADKNGIQNLFYFIEKDEELGIEYVGKMRASPVGDVYTSFEACPPFEIILQTQNKDLFKGNDTIQNLFTVVKSYAQMICPGVQTIVYTANDSPSLANSGVFFQETLNKDINALWMTDGSASFNRILNPIPKEKAIPSLESQTIRIDRFKTKALAAEKEKTQPMAEAIEPMEEMIAVHISNKSNDRVLFIDEPYLMKAYQTATTRNLMPGWYRVQATLEPMNDTEKKRTGISLKEKAAIIEISTAEKCTRSECKN